MRYQHYLCDCVRLTNEWPISLHAPFHGVTRLKTDPVAKSEFSYDTSLGQAIVYFFKGKWRTVEYVSVLPIVTAQMPPYFAWSNLLTVTYGTALITFYGLRARKINCGTRFYSAKNTVSAQEQIANGTFYGQPRGPAIHTGMYRRCITDHNKNKFPVNIDWTKLDWKETAEATRELKARSNAIKLAFFNRKR